MSLDTEKTRKLFSSIIQRPPLTDQLLQRPPFKFLHDIIKETIQNTGFLANIYTANELDSSNVVDKMAKIEFLQKLIKILNDDGLLKNVKAAKIVAGKEPEQTNLLLQKLAIEASNFHIKLLPSDKKKKEKKQHNKDDNESKGKYKRKEDKGSRERKEHSSNEKYGEKHSYDKSIEETKEKTRQSSERRKDKHDKVDQKRTPKSRDKSDLEKKKKKIKESSLEKNGSQITKRKISNNDDTIGSKPINNYNTEEEPSGTAKTEDSGIADIMYAENNVLNIHQVQGESLKLLTSGRPQTSMGRPGTAVARQAPPKIQKKRIEDSAPKIETNQSNPTIIDERKDDGGEEFIINVDPFLSSQTDDVAQLSLDEHGALVRKILETKKELEAGYVVGQTTNYAEINILDENEREKFKKEIDVLQKTIQQLTRTIYPLTRLLDFLQEDIESMMKEMEEWRNETKRNNAELRDFQTSSNDSSDLLMMKLNELDEEIREVRTTIARVKANVIANDEKIHSMMLNL